MNEVEYKERCDALFQKAKSLKLELLFEPSYFDPRRLDCLWHGGQIAEVKVSETLSIDISVRGDVYADLYDRKGRHIAHVKDKGNNAVFADVMQPYLKNDTELKNAIRLGKLELDYNNWIEYDGLISDESSQFRQKFVDLGLICDNVLEDNILSAIDEVLDSYENIVSEICYAAKDVYGILGGETV